MVRCIAKSSCLSVCMATSGDDDINTDRDAALLVPRFSNAYEKYGKTQGYCQPLQFYNASPCGTPTKVDSVSTGFSCSNHVWSSVSRHGNGNVSVHYLAGYTQPKLPLRQTPQRLSSRILGLLLILGRAILGRPPLYDLTNPAHLAYDISSGQSMITCGKAVHIVH